MERKTSISLSVVLGRRLNPNKLAVARCNCPLFAIQRPFILSLLQHCFSTPQSSIHFLFRSLKRMDPIFKFPASPGTPLFPVSPERANRQQLPHSPSLPQISHLQNDPFMTHSRGNSDVQGKVAQFNNLSKEAAQRRKDNEAAIKRAVLGREEAENETRRLREENRVLRQDVEEGRARERRVGERMEGVMVDLNGCIRITVLTELLGGAVTIERDTRTFAGNIREGDSPSKERGIQIIECTCEDARRAEVGKE